MQKEIICHRTGDTPANHVDRTFFIGQERTTLIKSFGVYLPDRGFNVGHHSLSKLIEDMTIGYSLCPCIMFGDRARNCRLQLAAQLCLKFGKPLKADLLDQPRHGGGRDLCPFRKTGNRAQPRDGIVLGYDSHKLALCTG